MPRPLFLALIALTATLGRTGQPAGPGAVPFQVREATPESAARELERVLGVPVEIRATPATRVTVPATPATGERLLEQVAAAVEGTWKLRLRVRTLTPGEARPNTEGAAPDRFLSLGIRDLPARKAFEVVAKELKAEVEFPPSTTVLAQRVSVLAVNVPVENVLDQVAEQSGAVWALTYVIEVPPMRVRVERPRPAEVVVVPVTPVAPTVRPVQPTAGGSAAPAPLPAFTVAQLRVAVKDALREALQAPAGNRELAVRETAVRLNELAVTLDRLTPVERLARIRGVASVVNHWRRVANGAAPPVTRELAPVTEVLERRFR